MNKPITNPFRLEEYRSTLAIKGKYKELKKTYTKSAPEIKDQNTSKLWDYLNIEARKTPANNPMEVDRLRVVESLIHHSSFTLLNIGFGSANLEERYYERHPVNSEKWYGIDISKQSVLNAKKKFPHASFSYGSIEALKFLDAYFDYVVSLEVLEHIKPSEILSALKEIYRVIKPGKYFIASVPLNEGLEYMIAHGKNPNAHVRTYSPELIKAEMEMTGFKVISEKRLYAFNRFYSVKSFIANKILKNKFHHNNIILMMQKPI